MIMPPTITSGPPPSGPGEKLHHNHSHNHHHHHPLTHHHHSTVSGHHHHHPHLHHLSGNDDSTLNLAPNTPPLSSSSSTTPSLQTTPSSGQSVQNSISDIVSTTTTTSCIVGTNTNNSTCNSNSTSSAVISAVDCAGCGAPILDRFYLSAVERHWHGHCLKCAQCKVDLQTERSCFARDGLIFCKSDYYRLFSMHRCCRCGEGIYANEQVMRVGDDSVFHLACFTCAWCAVALAQGDLFGMRDNLVYCRTHFEMIMGSYSMAYGTSASESLGAAHPFGSFLHQNSTNSHGLSQQHPGLHHGHSVHHPHHHPHGHHALSHPLPPPAHGHHHLQSSQGHLQGPPASSLQHSHSTAHPHDSLSGDTCSSLAATPYAGPSGLYSPLTIASSAGLSPVGSTNPAIPATPTSSGVSQSQQSQSLVTPTIRKGRPRKRKTAEHHQQQQQQNQQTSLIGQDQLLHPDSGLISGKISPSGSLDGGPLSGLAASIEATCNSQLTAAGILSGNGSNGGGGGGGGGRAKRMRTSFKHHQLRTMKTYFSVNQNPDAKDLKQLAQKTGLSKRVLQVWFQNARAKWRRNNLKLLPDGTADLGHAMLGLGLGSGAMTHPSTPSTVIGSPGGGSTRPFSSPSPNAQGASPNSGLSAGQSDLYGSVHQLNNAQQQQQQQAHQHSLQQHQQPPPSSTSSMNDTSVSYVLSNQNSCSGAMNSMNFQELY